MTDVGPDVHADDEVPFPLRRYRPPDLTPAQFEIFVSELVVDLLGPNDCQVEVLERIEGVDGAYKIDVTARYRVGEFDHLLLGEAKMHGRPIEREVVMVLNQKMTSVGAQKGVVFSTAGFQRGAIDFARRHGIALLQVNSDEVIIEVRSAGGEAKRLPGHGGASAVLVRGDASGGLSMRLIEDAQSARSAYAEWERAQAPDR